MWEMSGLISQRFTRMVSNELFPEKKKIFQWGKRNVLEANKMECDFLRSFFSEEKLRWWVTGKKRGGRVE